ncbi:MAG: FAD-binding protein [Pseudomonadota bacterium]
MVVIGGGSSGAFAAMRLNEAGVSTVIISQSSSCAFLSRGAVFANPMGLELPDEFMEKFLEVFPNCRFRRDGFVTVNATHVDALCAPFSAAGLSLLPDMGVTLVSLPGILDTPVETTIASVLESHGKETMVTEVRLQSSIEEFYLSQVQWARKLDNPKSRDDLFKRIDFQLQGKESHGFIFPPILGIEAHRECVQRLSRELDSPVYELLGVPGWPTGIRIGCDLEKAIARSGIEIMRDRVLSVEKIRGGDLDTVATETGRNIAGRLFILATGGICGGGIIFDKNLREPILDLPLFVNGRKASVLSSAAAAPAESFWSENFMQNDAIMSAGVHVDKEGRPLNEYDGPVSKNLRACGSIIASTGSGQGSPLDLGMSALSGWELAGKLIKTL